MKIRELKIFLSSPMDVAEEREMAVKVIADLNEDPILSGRFHLHLIRYEPATPPLIGNPQELVDRYAGKTTDADIVICTFGRRMGTKLNLGGVEFKSGTHYEFNTALHARLRRRPPRPEIFLYRMIKPTPAGETPEQMRQYAAVEGFFRRFTGDDALYGGLFRELHGTAEFGDSLATDLRNFLTADSPQPASLSSKLRKAFSFDTPLEQRRKFRRSLLDKVYRFWVENNLGDFTAGFRQPIQLRAELLRPPAAGKASEPGKSEPAVKLLKQQARRDRPKLVILGAKGAGKSFQLIEFVDHLLDRAQANEDGPVPVVLQLSSWARQGGSFETWIVNELATFYRMSRKLSERWIRNNDFDLCLDGLDEITVAAQVEAHEKDKEIAEIKQRDMRVACLREINAFLRSRNWNVGIVLCCREETYRELGAAMELPPEDDFTLLLLPLDDEQIEEHLEAERDHLSNLRMALKQDQDLFEMARTPYLLTTMTIAYNDRQCTNPEQILDGSRVAESRRRSLFNRYVRAKRINAQRVGRPGEEQRYTDNETATFLAKLARHMKTGGQPGLFLVERLQPDWLPPNRAILFSSLTAVFLFLFMLVSTIAPVALAIGVEIGMEKYRLHHASLDECVGAGFAKFLQTFSLLAISAGAIPALGFAFTRGWGFGVVLGFAFAISRGIAIGISEVGGGLAAGVKAGWVTALLSVPILGLLYWFRERKAGDRRDTIRPLEVRSWNWLRALLGVALGLAVGLIFWFSFGPAQGLGFGLGLPPFLAIVFGQFGAHVSLKTEPNQGIRQSLANALRYGAMLALIGFAAFGVGYGLGFYQRTHDLYLSIEQGLVNGLLGLVLVAGMLALGLMPFFKHVALRKLLVHYKRIPKRYVSFLEHATRLTLLRRVGGGYQFEHEFVREYYLEHPLDEAYLRSLSSPSKADGDKAGSEAR